MCLAIGSASPSRRTLIGRAWWHIACAPERLLPAGAALHLLLLLLLVTLSEATTAESFPYSGTVALLATANLAASGVLMTRFALWAERSPVHYMLYGSSFALGSGGLLLLELAMLSEPAWLLAAGAVLASGALLSLRGLGELYNWVRPSRRARAGTALAGIVLSVALMLGLSVLAP